MDNPNFRFVKLDICDREGVMALFEEEKPEVVVNFAAESHVDRSIEDLILEIYRVDGYTDSTGHHRSDLFNHASAGVIEHNGGVRIGYTPQKHVTVDCFTVQITPVIYILNCEHSWNIIMDLLMGKGRFYDA